MGRKRYALILMASTALVLTACASGHSGKPAASATAVGSWAHVVAEAKAEKKVVVYTVVPDPGPQPALAKAFTAAYGIKVQYVFDGSAEVMTKAQSELQSGTHAVDVI